MVKMVGSSNIFVIVGSKKNENGEIKNPNLIKNENDKTYFVNLDEKEVLIWDDKAKKPIYKYLIKKEVLNIEITKDKIIVICEKIIYVFNLKSLQLIDIIKTGNNPKGRFFGVSFKERNILIYPSIKENQGKLTIKNYDNKNYIYLNPHKNPISNIALSSNGHYLVTESNEEKLLKIFEVNTGGMLDELSFSNEKINRIKFMLFNPNNDYFIISCEKGKIPLYTMKKSKELVESTFEEDLKKSNIHTKKMVFWKDKDIAGIHVDLNNLDEIKDLNVKIGDYEDVKLGNENNLFIITSTGQYFRVIINIKTGKSQTKEMKLLY